MKQTNSGLWVPSVEPAPCDPKLHKEFGQPDPEREAAMINDKTGRIRTEVGKVIVGKDRTTDIVSTALLIGGHVLYEEEPGTGKTLHVRAYARTIARDESATSEAEEPKVPGSVRWVDKDKRHVALEPWTRIQMTGDLMPADIIGSPIWRQDLGKFVFIPGPIFGHFCLVDEINRAPGKVQSGLLEVMAERQVTVDGVKYRFPRPFVVVATQNPVDIGMGTTPLEWAQLDRFLAIASDDRASTWEKLYEQEYTIGKRQQHRPTLDDVESVVSLQEIRKMQHAVGHVHAEPLIESYIARLILWTRYNQANFVYVDEEGAEHKGGLIRPVGGASRRVTVRLMQAARAWAAIQGSEQVLCDHVDELLPYVLRHRLRLFSSRTHDRDVMLEQLLEQLKEQVHPPKECPRGQRCGYKDMKCKR